VNHTRLFQSARRAIHRQARRNKQVQTHIAFRPARSGNVFAGRCENLRERERVFFPVAGKPSAGSSLLPTRRNKILRESNFAEKSKFSPSNSFCAVPTDSGGTPRDASTRREEGGVEGTRRRPISKAGRLILPEETPQFEHRRW